MQSLLLARGYSSLGIANGLCESSTVDAIVSFQSGFLSKPDGLVDPGGKTWLHVSGTYLGKAGTPISAPVAAISHHAARAQTIRGLLQHRPGFGRQRIHAEPTRLTPDRGRVHVTLPDADQSAFAKKFGHGRRWTLSRHGPGPSATAISNHSWGTAIDLTLDGVLDTYGDDKVHYGLTLASIFNRHGWFCGAAFRTEDAMHFGATRHEGSRCQLAE